MKKIFFSLLLLIIFVTIGAKKYAPNKKATSMQMLVKVILDGDTIYGVDEHWHYKVIRLAGIDAPETPKYNKDEYGNQIMTSPGQPFANKAHKYLYDLLREENVIVELIGEDTFRRYVGLVYLNGNCVNLQLVKAGMAEVIPRDLLPKEKKIFLSAQKKAKKNKIGIWSQGNYYVSPRDYRENNSKKLRRERKSQGRYEYFVDKNDDDDEEYDDDEEEDEEEDD